jgi:hypothetical protein
VSSINIASILSVPDYPTDESTPMFSSSSGPVPVAVSILSYIGVSLLVAPYSNALSNSDSFDSRLDRP